MTAIDFLRRAAAGPFSHELQLCLMLAAGVTIPILVLVAGRL